MSEDVRIFNPEGVYKPTSPYSQACRVGSFLFVAGQTPTDVSGKTVEGGIGVQAQQALSNLRTVLASVGATPADVVLTRIYLTDMKLREQVAEARRSFFREPYPPNTLVEVSALAQPRWMIEIEAIAVLRGGDAARREK